MVEYELHELSNTPWQESKPCRNCEEKPTDKKQSMDDTNTIRVIVFKDSKDDYRVWSKLFLSAATVRGYGKILTGKKIKILSTQNYLQILTKRK